MRMQRLTKLQRSLIRTDELHLNKYLVTLVDKASERTIVTSLTCKALTITC